MAKRKEVFIGSFPKMGTTNFRGLLQTTPKVIKKAPVALNVTVSVASAEKKDIDKYNLPPDILSDLQEAFEFYDSERKNYISLYIPEVYQS
jgi:hypothetical protein